MIAHVLRRLGALVSGPPRADFSAIPPFLLRDVGLVEQGHIPAGPGVVDTSQPVAPANRAGRPFSFRIHPASELVEFRERSPLATLPDLRHNTASPLSA